MNSEVNHIASVFVLRASPLTHIKDDLFVAAVAAYQSTSRNKGTGNYGFTSVRGTPSGHHT